MTTVSLSSHIYEKSDNEKLLTTHLASVKLFRSCSLPLNTPPSAMLMESFVNHAPACFASWSFHACQPAFSLLSSVFSMVAFVCENNVTADNSRAKPSAVKAIRRILLLWTVGRKF